LFVVFFGVKGFWFRIFVQKFGCKSFWVRGFFVCLFFWFFF
jgi:hypothetical protein